MPPYGGFDSLSDYLVQRCRENGLSYQAASLEIGATTSYVHDLIKGRIGPSSKRCEALAKLFGDPPRLVKILAGVETAPVELDKTISAILDVAQTLTTHNKSELLRYARFLKDGEKGR
jgi:hypothetical protein